MIWVIIGVAVVVVAVGAFIYLRRRRMRESRLISFVALVREHVPLDPAVLAHAASKAWNADLGDGNSEGADGYVAGMGIVATIFHDGRMYLINSFPKPYTEDVEKAAESMSDLRLRSLFLEHKAWFSCDALGVDHKTPDSEIQEWYQRLARLFVELLDENSLLIYLPDADLGFPINEDTERALRSSDPIGALHETATVPIIQVSEDDPRMKQAVAKARAQWPKFLAAFEAQAGKNFGVKAPVTYGENTEFIWLSVTAIEGEKIYGELGNDPHGLGPLRLGSKVSVPVAELNDWCYLDRNEKMVGGFTIEVVMKASQRGQGRS
jgi:uncharacterized protein YegJ (DUF2314 family)